MDDHTKTIAQELTRLNDILERIERVIGEDVDGNDLIRIGQTTIVEPIPEFNDPKPELGVKTKDKEEPKKEEVKEVKKEESKIKEETPIKTGLSTENTELVR